MERVDEEDTKAKVVHSILAKQVPAPVADGIKLGASLSKKSPTGPTEQTPKPEYLIARSQLTERGPLGFGPIQFLMDFTNCLWKKSGQPIEMKLQETPGDLCQIQLLERLWIWLVCFPQVSGQQPLMTPKNPQGTNRAVKMHVEHTPRLRMIQDSMRP